MDSFELNKIAGAVLATGLGVMALSIISEAIYSPGEPAKPGYEIATNEGGEAAGGGATAAGGAPGVTPIAARLQTADAKKGEQVAKKCMACHTLDKGQPNKVGPNLYGVVGTPIIHPDNGFNYSQAFQEKGKAGFTWTFENLDAFLAEPRKDIPGTAMSFAGLPKPEDRADIIAYLRSLSDNPVPLPPPPPPGAGGAAANAPAPGGTAAPAAAPGGTAAPAPGGAAAPAEGGSNNQAAAGAPTAAANAPAANAQAGNAPAGANGGAPASFVEEVKAADPKVGEASARKCLACHTFEKGQPNKVGPNLYGVVGTPIIRPETGYEYSQAFQDKGKQGLTWTFDNLNQFLTSPKTFIPGTKMTFAGISKEQERAEVVAYLRTLAENPAPLPEAGGANGGAAPAAGGGQGAPNPQPTPAPGGTAPTGDGASAPTAPAQ